MSTENAVFRLPFEAAEDLSNYQYHFVVLETGSGKIRLPDSGQEIALGILQNAPASGQAGSVMILGKSKLVANGALSIGKFVKPEYVASDDAGKGEEILGKNWMYTRARVLEPAGAEDELCAVELIGPFPYQVGPLVGQTGITTLSTNGDETYSADQLSGGLILRDPAGADRSDVTPTAEQIAAVLLDAAAGGSIDSLSFEFSIRNTADANETITLTAGSGVTLSGTMSIAQNNTRRFLCVMNSASSATIYSLGTALH